MYFPWNFLSLQNREKKNEKKTKTNKFIHNSIYYCTEVVVSSISIVGHVPVCDIMAESNQQKIQSRRFACLKILTTDFYFLFTPPTIEAL